MSPDARNDELLSWTLTIAVPMWIERIRDLPTEQRIARARACAQVVAEHGDNVLYRSKRRGETAAAFNALAEALACLAYQPGGVQFAGQQFIAT
jgi:hypothetical protein